MKQALKPTDQSGLDSLDAASAVVRSYCGWHVAPSKEETIKVSAYGGRSIALPTKHITDVSAVKVGDRDVTSAVDWDEAGVITLRGGRFPDRSRSVEVTLTHGWDLDEIPDVMAIVQAVAGRVMESAQRTGSVMMQSGGPFSVRYQARGDGLVGGAALFEAEKEVLAAYKVGGQL